MPKMEEILSNRLGDYFEKAGYDRSYASVRPSDRPDLGDYQCSGALICAKIYHEAPLVIAQKVTACIDDAPFEAEAVRPGFINLRLHGDFLASQLEELRQDDRLGIPQAAEPETIIIDYGGPNVAKPLHVGHLRAAVIGESIKRLLRALGHNVLGDVHLGDWGLQMGLIITELHHRSPELPYFTQEEGPYPEEAPFTIAELEEIYPGASARSKTDEAYREEALEATRALQEGHPGYRALWEQITRVSVSDLKKNYERLNVEFDLWKSESDVQSYIPGIVGDLKERGIARYDQGALVVDIAEPGDKKELPPCIILKSDGAALYSTTDVATIYERMQLFRPDRIIYVVDKRQEMHFIQVFRTVRKAGIVGETTTLTHVGFGTMNGKDGKPFKTRDGGVLRLEYLLDDIENEMTEKIRDNRNVRAEDAGRTARLVALAALKYGDLQNQASKDYIFDVDKFTSFEGNTGPYILYTIVRIRSILEKAKEEGYSAGKLLAPCSEPEKDLMLDLTGFGEAVGGAAAELAPHRLCGYIYHLSNNFNRFYHETRIVQESDEMRRSSYLALLELVWRVLVRAIDILGFEAPEHM